MTDCEKNLEDDRSYSPEERDFIFGVTSDFGA